MKKTYFFIKHITALMLISVAFIFNAYAQPTISIDDVTLNEGNAGTTNFIFTVTLSSTWGSDITIDFNANDAKATTANSDYVDNDNTLTITSGSTTGTITIIVNGDLNIEANETFTVDLSNASIGIIIDAQGIGTISDDDDMIDPTASNPPMVWADCIFSIPFPDISVVNDEADNYGTPTVAFVSDISDGSWCPEIITRTYSVTDSSNNSINVTQMVVIDDVIFPTASNPFPINIESINDMPPPNMFDVTDEADNCGIPTVHFVSDISDGLGCPETITRTFGVMDSCGNTINVTQTITILDTQDPIVTGTLTPTSLGGSTAGDAPIAVTTVAALEALTGGITISDASTDANIVVTSSDTSAGTCPIIVTRTYTLTDECGNSSNLTHIINIEGTPPIISDIFTIDPTDCGLDDGAIDIVASGAGILEYSIDSLSWTMTSLFTGLTAGTYSISVREEAPTSCITTNVSQTYLSDPVAPIIANVIITNPTDCGVTDGIITITATGAGILEYSIDGISWTNTTGVFTGLSDGTYSISVREQASPTCYALYFDQTLIAPVAPVIVSVAPTNPTDCSIDDGTITITATGAGTLEYCIDGFTWANTTGAFWGLTDATYSISVREQAATNCIDAVADQTLIAPVAPVISNVTITDPTECNVNDGTINIIASGTGTLEYSIDGISWTNTTGVFTGLTVSTYSIGVREQAFPNCITIGINQIISFIDLAPLIVGNLDTARVESCVTDDIPAAVSTVAALEALAGGITITDCTTDENIVVTSNDTLVGTCPIVVTRTYTVTDEYANASTIEHTIYLDDTGGNDIEIIYGIEKLQIFPNPTSNNVFIRSLNTSYTICNVRVLSLEGKQLLTKSFNANECVLSIEALESGIYLIEINNTDVFKIIKE